ncbi:LOB domain-containing protein 7-like [Hordeum vulgare]|nr:LOB domain-containing protein 7-like [Hordeum vulgare]
MTGGVNGNGGGGACAVCKHQRRKCEPNCELAAYFPANRMNDFRALHLVFGVANLTKLIKANATEAARRRAAETLTWEARWRERDPSEGCYREVSCLRRENAVLRAENAALRRRADQCACCATTLQQHQQQILLVSAYNNGARPPGGVLHGASAGVVPGGYYNGNAGAVRTANGNARPHVSAQAPQTTMAGYAQGDRHHAASNGARPGAEGQAEAREKSNARCEAQRTAS